MIDAQAYWDRRYRKGGISGAGSRGPEAADKIDLVNAVVETNEVSTLLDLGVGDGFVASGFEVPLYVGYDPSLSALVEARKRLPSAILTNRLPCRCERFDLVVSMDVIFHLVDPKTYAEYMEALFSYSDLVLVYGTNRDEAGRSHVLHRVWTRDVPAGWIASEISVAFKQAWILRRDE